MSSSPEVDHINDSDYLCAFASTLHEINQDARRNSSEYPVAQKRYAILLDALARLAVREPRDQVVAIGAVMAGKSDPTELYVATNAGVVPLYIVAHLDDICRRILHIRATIKTSPEPMRLLNAIRQDRYVLKEPVTEPVLVALRELQHVLYNHSIERLRARFAKLGWEEKLQHLFACINASSGAVVLDSLSEGEQYALERLKASPSVQNDFPDFEEGVQLFHDAIEKQDVAAIHDASVLLMGFNNRHAKASVLLLCDTFINAYAKRTGKGAGKHHSLSKWLSKISFVTAEYGKLIKIFTDSHLSDMFHDSVVIRPIANNPPMRPYTTALEPNAIKKTLNALEFTSDDFDDDEPRTYAQLINDIQTTSARTQVKRVHCECALLCYLDRMHGRSMVPYIGVSKLSCAFCDLFFAAYREKKKGLKVYTHGTHGQTTAWMWPPAFPGDDLVKAEFCRRLYAYIKDRLSEEQERRRRQSKASQSTTASHDSDDLDSFEAARLRLQERRAAVESS